MSTGRSATAQAAARFRAFESDFWRLWYAGLTTSLVRWMETLAVAVFVFQHTGSPFLVAMMTMLRILPMGLFGSLMGVWAERMQRRTALIAVLLLLTAADAALTILAQRELLSVWHIAIGTFINGIGWAADNPVRRVAMGEVAGTERMGTAMSIDVATNNLARILGPIIGGGLLAVASIQAVFAVAAALGASTVLIEATLQYRNQAAESARRSVLAGIAESVRIARQHRRLAAALAVTIIYNIFGWPFTSMVPVIAEQHLRLGPGATGILASMDGAGAFIGALVMAVAAPARNYGRLYVLGMAVYCAMVTAFAVSPTPVSAGTALVLEGVGGAAYSILQATLVYNYSPPEMRSRLLGLVSTCIGIGPVGFFLLGWMANLIGAQWATALSGIGGLIALAVTWPFWRALVRGV